jgi:hypothetical protein
MSSSGDIDVLTSGGAFTIEETVTATTTGNITLKTDDTAAAGDDLSLNAGVTVNATGGNVSLEAGDNITLTATSVVNAGGTIAITGDCNDADPGTGVTLTIAAQLTSSGGTINGGADSDTFNIFYPDGATNSGTNVITDLGGANDQVIIHGTPGVDDIYLTTDAPTGPNDELVTRGNPTDEAFQIPDGIDELFLLGGDANDIFHIQPSMLFPVTVNGESPVFGDPGVPPGDQLELDPLGNSFNFVGKSIQVNGGQPNPFQLINLISIENIPLTPESAGPDQRFDFNDTMTNNGAGITQTPTQPGFTGVTSSTVFDPNAATSFGWNVPVSEFSQGTNTAAASALVNDGHFFTPSSGAVTRTFSTTVGNGYVLVTVTFGKDTAAVEGLQIVNADDGTILASGLDAAAGETNHVTFLVLVTDGSLNLQFSDPFANAQGRRMVAIQGIDIETGENGLGFFGMGFAAPAGTLDADGTTIDTFTLSAAPPYSLVTVETTLGTIVGSDADPNIQGFQVLTDGSGEAPIMIQRPSSAGNAIVSFSSPTGAKTGCVAINYGQVNTLRFDLNTPTSATFEPFDATTNPDGWIGVSPNATFTPTQGYGWLTAPEAFLLSPSSGSDLFDDGHRDSAPNTFRTLLDDGTYEVTVTLGDEGAQLGTTINANGVEVVSNQAVERREFLQRSFTVSVIGGQLDLQFSQTNNVAFGPHWAVNAISIVPTTLLAGTVTAGANVGSVAADGTTSSAITFNTTAPDGTLFTVTSTLGTVTTADADSVMAGIQVASAGGMISLDITSPTMSGTPTFTLSSSDGQFSGTINAAAFLTFAAPAVRRFDFNNGSKTGTVSATAAGFTSVSRDHQSPATDGFGFGENNLVSFVTTFGDVPGATNDDLFRDGVQNGHTTSTFLIQAAAATDYDLRVYLGHQFLTRDNIEVTVEGADVSTQTAATTRESGPRFTNLLFTNADDTSGDGYITLSFVDPGGSNFGYSINGVDIATASNLPVAETLQSRLSLRESTHNFPTITTTDLAPVIELATAAFNQLTLTADQAATLATVDYVIADLTLTADQAATLATVDYVIADLTPGVLAEYLAGTIYIDDDAGGAGWSSSLASRIDSSKFDLLTVLAHELGHALGFEHSEVMNDLMNETLNAGQRNESFAEIDDFFADVSDDSLHNDFFNQ